MDEIFENVTLDTIESQYWIMSIPNDWIQKENGSDSKLYFENKSGTMGVYILTKANQEKVYDTLQIQAFLSMEKGFLNEMEGYNFQIKEQLGNGQGYVTGVIDSYDISKKYRIRIKYVARDGTFVRFTIHDYNYQLDNLVNQISDFIINSLELRQDSEISN